MLAVRAAILALATTFLILPIAPSGGSRRSQGAAGDFAAYRLDRVIVQPAVVSRPRTLTVRSFAPWKARPKMFLGESDHQLPEEIDLGRVVVPRGLSSPAAATASRPPALSPLRC
jgi:hypothetical protein